MSKIFDYLSGRNEQKVRMIPTKENLESKEEVLNGSEGGKSDMPDAAPETMSSPGESFNPSYPEVSMGSDADKPFASTGEVPVPPNQEASTDTAGGKSDMLDAAPETMSSPSESVRPSYPADSMHPDADKPFASTGEGAIQPAEEVSPGPNGDKSKESDAAPEPVPSPVSKPGIRSSASFSLDLADYRIKSVLDPVTEAGEQFRLLRARLSQEQKRKKIKTMLVTSAAPGEGKTFTSCSLAGVLAQEPEKKVLLIDADMRRSMAGRGLGLPDSEISGLSDVLRGNIDVMDALLRSDNNSLFFLPSGCLPSNPSELLSSPNLEKSLKTVSRNFDWVIIDSPPVIALADTNVIAPICDAILLIIHANGTPSKMVQDSIDRIGRDKVCGVIMNRMKNHKSSKYYHNYYRHGKSAT